MLVPRQRVTSSVPIADYGLETGDMVVLSMCEDPCFEPVCQFLQDSNDEHNGRRHIGDVTV